MQTTIRRLVALRMEAAEAGDVECVALCIRALSGDDEARIRCLDILADAKSQIDYSLLTPVELRRLS
jgi:hypothetical protein